MVGAGVGATHGIALFGASACIVYLKCRHHRDGEKKLNRSMSAQQGEGYPAAQQWQRAVTNYRDLGYQQPELAAEREISELSGHARADGQSGGLPSDCGRTDGSGLARAHLQSDRIESSAWYRVKSW